MISYKRWQIIFTFISLIVLASSYYFQYVKGLQPCPLCLMQRMCVMLLLVISTLGIICNQLKTMCLLTRLQILFATLGLFFAVRQLWLQFLSIGQAPACMPELSVLVRYFPWRDLIHALFWGAGDCAEVSWQWLGLSMPGWAGLYFLLMNVTGILLIKRLAHLLLHTQHKTLSCKAST